MFSQLRLGVVRSSLLAVGVLVVTCQVSRAEIIINPAITASATPYSASYAPAWIFNSSVGPANGPVNSEYASAGLGANTFINFDFGVPTTIDSFGMTARFSGDLDKISSFDLRFSQNATFGDADDIVRSFSNPATSRNEFSGPLVTFPATTARYVQWDVTGTVGASLPNQGASEMRFLNSSQGVLVPATVINGATAYNANYALNNAVDGFVGYGTGLLNAEYASQGLGNNTFVDFNLGALTPISGFDLFQRLAPADHFTNFDLLFATDAAFTNIVAIKSYQITGDADPWTEWDHFDRVMAQYVRLDVTAGSAANPGISEILFYAEEIPEPASIAVWSLFGLGLAGIRYYRHRRQAS